MPCRSAKVDHGWRRAGGDIGIFVRIRFGRASSISQAGSRLPPLVRYQSSRTHTHAHARTHARAQTRTKFSRRNSAGEQRWAAVASRARGRTARQAQPLIWFSARPTHHSNDHDLLHHDRHHDLHHDRDNGADDYDERSWRYYDGWALARSINNKTNS